MNRYRIEQLEVYMRTYIVEAEDDADAIIKIFDGEAAPVDTSPQLADLCDERGLHAADYPHLAERLRCAGIMTDHECVIPTIFSIENVA